jgi:hypothetical protein
MVRTPTRKARGASLPVEIRLALFQLDERVHAWNEADEAHDHDTRERLTEEIDALAETLFLAVLRHFGSKAVREHFGDDAPRLDGQGSENTRLHLPASALVNDPRSHAGHPAGMGQSSTFQRVTVETGSGNQEGCLVFVEGRLVAVLVRPDGKEHAERGLQGKWFLETGFGLCAGGALPTPVFASLDEAQQWVHERVAAAGRES